MKMMKTTQTRNLLTNLNTKHFNKTLKLSRIQKKNKILFIVTYIIIKINLTNKRVFN